VKRSVEFIAQLAVFFFQCKFGGIVYELLQTSRTSSIIVCFNNISEGNRFTSHGSANPVCVWKIHTNWCTWGSIASFSGNVHYFVGYANNIFLFVLVHQWGIVLEPLCIFRQ